MWHSFNMLPVEQDIERTLNSFSGIAMLPIIKIRDWTSDTASQLQLNVFFIFEMRVVEIKLSLHNDRTLPKTVSQNFTWGYKYFYCFQIFNC